MIDRTSEKKKELHCAGTPDMLTPIESMNAMENEAYPSFV